MLSLSRYFRWRGAKRFLGFARNDRRGLNCVTPKLKASWALFNLLLTYPTSVARNSIYFIKISAISKACGVASRVIDLPSSSVKFSKGNGTMSWPFKAAITPKLPAAT